MALLIIINHKTQYCIGSQINSFGVYNNPLKYVNISVVSVNNVLVSWRVLTDIEFKQLLFKLKYF